MVFGFAAFPSPGFPFPPHSMSYQGVLFCPFSQTRSIFPPFWLYHGTGPPPGLSLLTGAIHPLPHDSIFGFIGRLVSRLTLFPILLLLTLFILPDFCSLLAPYRKVTPSTRVLLFPVSERFPYDTAVPHILFFAFFLSHLCFPLFPPGSSFFFVFVLQLYSIHSSFCLRLGQKCVFERIFRLMDFVFLVTP